MNRLLPVAVAGTLRFRTLAAGGIQTCAIATDARPYCWGMNTWGAIGQPDMDM
jgi:alpha-tubulin suppressor-like RCC1 family protein